MPERATFDQLGEILYTRALKKSSVNAANSQFFHKS
jgi:hypothetical protein